MCEVSRFGGQSRRRKLNDGRIISCHWRVLYWAGFVWHSTGAWLGNENILAFKRESCFKVPPVCAIGYGVHVSESPYEYSV
jgi:hypothetical protein